MTPSDLGSVTERLQLIRQRVEAASPGPWSYDHRGVVAGTNDEVTIASGLSGWGDSMFIASARDDVPMLVVMVEAAIEYLAAAGVAIGIEEVARVASDWHSDWHYNSRTVP